MGWSVELKSDRIITEEEITVIVNELPKEFSFPLGNSKQPWGWSTGADISIPEDNKLKLSGSYGVSGNIAERFVEYITTQLEESGHIIIIQYSW
ncbi:hypothetical protein BSK59_13180 [Paenibacillus odorifer]|uniref:hypothetical protein n=1 Tax=Paenibacillus odorifer TaxID=189426 RepID=UPI00096C001E|nr:hypothetical protein [Paenibacillus odorifer]OME55425.1 hypothetical protein BSK59_13180 [Paenibacillus odorifer]